MIRIGIDLGGTKIEGIALDAEGNELFRKRISTHQEQGYDAIVLRIKGLHDDIAAAVNSAEHTVGIGTPGAVSLRTGLLKNSNTVCLNGRPLKSDLERVLDRRIAIQNDANCFAEAEALMGAGKGRDFVFGVIMGTGCGGGIVCKGEVVTGLQAIAGEWGHTSIDPNGPECYCGSRGCVETFISGGGLERMWQAQHREECPLRDIVGRYRSGDGAAVPFMETFFANFGRALANLIDILDPDIVVLGGGLSNIAELYTEGVAQVARCVFSDSLETPVVKNELGDSSGVIGAALIGI